MTIIISDLCNIGNVAPASPDFTGSFSEGALLIAVNLLTQRCIRECGSTPDTICIYVAPALAFVAESALRYPQALQTLNLIDSGVLGEIVVCRDIPGDAPNSPWAVESDPATGSLLVTSSGTTSPVLFEPEILYKR